MSARRRLIRNLDAEQYQELFLVSAVLAILLIRFYLRMTGYPQIAGGVFHIAHMLWGGLLMLMALVVLLTFLGRDSVRFAAVIGGLGFGTFIDEIGKFITKDYDYFFAPSVAIIYVIFVLVTLASRAFLRRALGPEEYLLNALQELEELALHDMDRRERGRAEELLRCSDPTNPLVPALQAVLQTATLVADAPPTLYDRARRRLRDGYLRLTRQPKFRTALVIFFAAQLATRVLYVVLVVFFPWTLPTPEGGPPPHVSQRLGDLTFADWGQLLTTAFAALFVAAGIAALPRSRRFAYRMFKSSTLITILLTQVFMFYDEQFSAVVGLCMNVLVLLALQAALDIERSSDKREPELPAGLANATRLAVGRDPER
jgi:hypothetical protein